MCFLINSVQLEKRRDSVFFLFCFFRDETGLITSVAILICMRVFPAYTVTLQFYNIGHMLNY